MQLPFLRNSRDQIDRLDKANNYKNLTLKLIITYHLTHSVATVFSFCILGINTLANLAFCTNNEPNVSKSKPSSCSTCFDTKKPLRLKVYLSCTFFTYADFDKFISMNMLS